MCFTFTCSDHSVFAYLFSLQTLLFSFLLPSSAFFSIVHLTVFEHLLILFSSSFLFFIHIQVQVKKQTNNERFKLDTITQDQEPLFLSFSCNIYFRTIHFLNEKFIDILILLNKFVFTFHSFLNFKQFFKSSFALFFTFPFICCMLFLISFFSFKCLNHFWTRSFRTLHFKLRSVCFILFPVCFLLIFLYFASIFFA